MGAMRQSVTGTVTNGGTLSYTFNTLSGTRLLYLSVTSNTGQSISSITDTQTNTWAEVSGSDVTVGAFRFEAWEATAGSAAANTITANFSSFVGAPRVWLCEVYTDGSLTFGTPATHDQTSAQDPMTLASVTAGGDGIAIVWCATDTTHTFNAFLGYPMWDMNGGANSRAGWNIIFSGASVAPTIDFSTTESGESMMLEVFDSGGGGGGETAHVFS